MAMRTERVAMATERSADMRRIAFVAGVLFLSTFITAIAAFALFQPVLDDPAGYIAGAFKTSPGELTEVRLVAHPQPPG
jgi:hypothetical protein